MLIVLRCSEEDRRDYLSSIVKSDRLLVAAFVVMTAINLIGGALIFLTIRFAPEAIEVGLPAAIAAMSVGPGVPRWVGHSKSDTVIRLSAPINIGTAKFRPSVLDQQLALVVAAAQAGPQFDGAFPRARRATLDKVPKLEALMSPFRGQSRDFSAEYWSAVVDSTARLTRRHISGEGTFVAAFYALLCSATPFFYRIGDVLFGNLLWAGFLWYALRRAVAGRVHNQSLDVASPRTNNWIKPLLAGALWMGIGYGQFYYIEGSFLPPAKGQLEGSDALYFAFAFCMLLGFGFWLSALSRALTNAAVHRYEDEIGNRDVAARTRDEKVDP